MPGIARDVDDFDDLGSELVGYGLRHSATLMPRIESLQSPPDVPQILDNLAHLIGRKPPSVSVSDQSFRGIGFKPQHSSASCLDCHTCAELVSMRQFLIYRSSGRPGWQKYCFLVQRQAASAPFSKIALGAQALIHDPTSGPKIGSNRVNFGLRKSTAAIPAGHGPSRAWRAVHGTTDQLYPAPGETCTTARTLCSSHASACD